jgi:uncharacterized protein DUF4231
LRGRLSCSTLDASAPTGRARGHDDDRAGEHGAALSGDPTFDRLEAQIDWYDRRSRTNQRLFKLVKGVQLIAAAAIPVVATLDAHPAIPAALGALIVVLEGVQQLNQYQQNWSAYRSTCEALKHEKYLFLAHAGPYAGSEDGRRCSPTASRG